MRLRLWPEDTIAWRYALTIVSSVVVAVVLAGVVIRVAGASIPPTVRDLGLLERAHDVLRMIRRKAPAATPAVGGSRRQ
jgi:hypothetical protein